jgi:hypothetical protein
MRLRDHSSDTYCSGIEPKVLCELPPPGLSNWRIIFNLCVNHSSESLVVTLEAVSL